MKKKAKIRIEFDGKTYRVGNSTRCASKRDCSLFERGLCDSDDMRTKIPCEAICKAFSDIWCGCPPYGFKEVWKLSGGNRTLQHRINMALACIRTIKNNIVLKDGINICRKAISVFEDAYERS